jgi:hypothetical protein
LPKIPLAFSLVCFLFRARSSSFLSDRSVIRFKILPFLVHACAFVSFCSFSFFFQFSVLFETTYTLQIGRLEIDDVGALISSCSIHGRIASSLSQDLVLSHPSTLKIYLVFIKNKARAAAAAAAHGSSLNKSSI